MSKYGKIRGAIRWYSRLPKLRKPFFAFLYSRLSTWANAVDEGLNRVRGFNSVSAARYRLSRNPNCELFPQGPIIPVPLSALPHRPVGAVGNTRVVFPGRNEKRKPSNQRARGPLFPLFRWWLCPAAMPKQHQTVLAAPKREFRSQFPLFPLKILILHRR